MRVVPVNPVPASLRWLIALALVIASGVAGASPLSESVVRASPLGGISEHYPAMISKGIRDGLVVTGRVEPALAETIAALVGRAYRGVDIRARLETDLDTAMDNSQLQAVLDWYQSPLGERIAQAEVAASRPQNWARIEARAADLKKQYEGSKRAAMFERFDAASRSTERTVDTIMAVQAGLAPALSVFMDNGDATPEATKQKLEAQRPVLRGLVRQQVYIGYLYIYEAFGQDELDLYLDFLESEPGATFTRVVTDSVQQEILAPVDAIARQLAWFRSGFEKEKPRQ